MKDESSRDGSVTAVDAGTVVNRSPEPISVGDVLAARYEVRAVLGRGGMGLVVAARDRTLGIDVAIKLLRPELVGERRWAERLAREVKIARQLHHPNVCRVFDFVQADGRVFIVMELATGTLAAELESGAVAASGLEERLSDARAIVAGLAAIHESQIVHRDVTAQNVLRLADGRLVASDFGLATDAEETTASLQGGTVAYMAPELVVGGRASFTSDVWALGLVIHEVVFGSRPTWRGEGARRGIERPGRRLTSVEKAVLEVCRACAALNPSNRPRDARAVAGMLDRLGAYRVRRFAKTAAMMLAVVMGLGAVAWAASTAVHRRSGAPASSVEVDKRIEITGTPADWTATSRVLAAIEGRIHCLVALPDQRTLRMVWGLPKRAEDVDVESGVRRPSPLVPAAYAEGCPDLAPDGKLVFQGYDAGGRPAILMSSRSDGANAESMVGTADPDGQAEPKWISSGSGIVFNVDPRHIGVMDVKTRRFAVVPENVDPVGAAAWMAGVSGVFTVRRLDDGVYAEAVNWPSMERVLRFSIASIFHDCQKGGGDQLLFCSMDGDGGLVKVDLAQGRAVRIGRVPGEDAIFVAPVSKGLAFVSLAYRSDGWIHSSAGPLVRLTTDGITNDGARCGERGYIFWRRDGIFRTDSAGSMVPVTRNPSDKAPFCSKDARNWWFVRPSGDAGLYRCDEDSCERVLTRQIWSAALSPDERRIALLGPGTRRFEVSWVSRDGGPVHQVVGETEVVCAPGWASDRTLWVSRKRGGAFVWTEVDVDSRRATGREVPGSKNCDDGDPDPLSPVSPDLRFITARTSRIRFKDLP